MKSKFKDLMTACSKVLGISAESSEASTSAESTAVDTPEIPEETPEEEPTEETPEEETPEEPAEEEAPQDQQDPTALLVQAVGTLGQTVAEQQVSIETLETSFNARVTEEAQRLAVAQTASQGVPTTDLPASTEATSEQPKSVKEFMASYDAIEGVEAKAAFYAKHEAKIFGAGN